MNGAFTIIFFIVLVIVIGYVGYTHSTFLQSSLGHLLQSQSCPIESCPMNLYQSDANKIYTYAVGDSFNVFLDPTQNPPADLRCTPNGVIEFVSNIASSQPSLYGVSFTASQVGTCTLTDDNFSMNIAVQNFPQ